MNRTKQYILYIFFAFLSALINILTQIIIQKILYIAEFDFLKKAVLGNINSEIIIKMLIATVVAFLFKFIVDKVVIFQDKTTNLKENFTKITVYGFFAIFTTIIFWGFEISFKYFFSFKYSEYFGGVIGLALGYTIKFILDSKFVFQPSKKN